MTKSFYELDYIIEINEQRVEQYAAMYQKVQEKLTNIIIIYSGITVFFVAVIQDIISGDFVNAMMPVLFVVFLIILIISIYYTVRLIIPVEFAYLEPPQHYYSDLRQQYESAAIPGGNIGDLLKASYIDELEKTIATNTKVVIDKNYFYNRALTFGLIAVIPFLFCLGFHLSKKDDKVQKIRIINSEKSCILHKIDSTMTNSNKKTESAPPKLPGIESSMIIRSSPILIKENKNERSSKPLESAKEPSKK